MSYVDVLEVKVLDNPAKYTDDLRFKITFQCKTKTKEDLDWRITWVGSAKDEQYDQILDEVAVPPDVGVNTFEYVVDAPDPSKIPGSEIIGVTVVMVQALYKGKEFLRVGYYVKVDYADLQLREEPPEVERPDVELLERNIIEAEPRVTRYLIEWDDIGVASMAATPEHGAVAGGVGAAMEQEGGFAQPIMSEGGAQTVTVE
uniref:Anti-silencing function protein 1 n=1 Tax=Hemiselmis andersenii TaxID=464988 RepID=A0A6U4W771_HEMAN|mmetsp:Transcript_30390/g.74443  ORF Transcript_30390/g.74443 Transcript_30390/m.74443 type:complete len:202 (-) Transcript_30390:95-700(-)|eukprot:CAMPEP_0114133278 /NCGR_PEP_ID=MMETSP0043_2-20121206/13542_1 /TAXON_ID=464988 /ORGANISM="Hemiselmis andersenii, Strain CCMP644" /LENGTH=201 /DNA_ID=CAMNT_0001226847 /DNA_START=138 /DNA_END=743 /DNA_ORIENTATION=-